MRTGEGRHPSSGESRVTLPLSILTLYVLKNAHLDWRGPSSSLSLWIQMLTSSRNSLTDTPSSNVLLALWASLSPINMTHQINHRRWVLSSVSNNSCT